MTRVSDTLAQDDELRVQYRKQFKQIVRWLDYANGGPLPVDLIEDDDDGSLRQDLGTAEGRELLATWALVYRIELRQLLVCLPDEDYNLSEMLRLCLQVQRRLNELSRLVSAEVLQRRFDRGIRSSYVPSLAMPLPR